MIQEVEVGDLDIVESWQDCSRRSLNDLSRKRVSRVVEDLCGFSAPNYNTLLLSLSATFLYQLFIAFAIVL